MFIYKLNIKPYSVLYLMDFELIVAFNKKNVIGINNTIPWYVPEDLKQFRKTTKDHIVLMGRKTFESLPNGPLKNRINVVITNKIMKSDNTDVYFCNFDDSFALLKKLQKETEKKVFIIGGNTIYNQYFKYCTQFHITVIDDDQDGDTIFPYNIQYFQDNYTLVTKDVKNDFTYFMFEK